MEEWINRQIATGFADLQGTAFSGTVAVKQELINELLAAFLANPSTAAAPGVGQVDPAKLLALVRRAAIRAEAGTLYLDFDVAVRG